MSISGFSRLRLIGPLTVAAALGVGTLPALAQSVTTMAPLASDCSAIHFDLANPAPGTMIEPGGLVLQGIATDTRAQNSLGIDRVDFFLDNRDQGGLNIGTAVPGVEPLAGPDAEGAVLPLPLGPDSFATTVSIPNVTGPHDLFAYAHSSVTGAESVIDVPVAVNEDPAKAGDAGATTTETCMPGNTTAEPTAPAPAATTPTTPAPAPATSPATTTTTTTTAVEPTASTIMLDVANPSPGDTIHVGGYVIDGTALDKAAPSGSGIDRVDIILDNRDTGGTMLTDATPGANDTWSATVPLPSNVLGPHTLYFYAHSSVTGQEEVVSIPVTIDP
jgi:hypothetical protein